MNPHPARWSWLRILAANFAIVAAYLATHTMSDALELPPGFATPLFPAVGHGMARDPHVPWIAKTLNNAAIEDPNKRAERLHSKAMTYLDEILASL